MDGLVPGKDTIRGEMPQAELDLTCLDFAGRAIGLRKKMDSTTLLKWRWAHTVSRAYRATRAAGRCSEFTDRSTAVLVIALGEDDGVRAWPQLRLSHY